MNDPSRWFRFWFRVVLVLPVPVPLIIAMLLFLTLVHNVLLLFSLSCQSCFARSLAGHAEPTSRIQCRAAGNFCRRERGISAFGPTRRLATDLAFYRNRRMLLRTKGQGSVGMRGRLMRRQNSPLLRHECVRQQ